MSKKPRKKTKSQKPRAARRVPTIKVDLSDWDFSHLGAQLAKAAVSFELDNYGNAELKFNVDSEAFEAVAKQIAAQSLQDILTADEWGNWDITPAGLALTTSAVQTPEGAIMIPWSSIVIGGEDDAKLLERFIAGARARWARDAAAEDTHIVEIDKPGSV